MKSAGDEKGSQIVCESSLLKFFAGVITFAIIARMAESTNHGSSSLEVRAEDAFSSRSTRRDFLRRTAMAATAIPLIDAGTLRAEADKPGKRPNVLLVISDQYRWDFICAYGQNPMNFTPNLDAMFRRGTVFRNAFTNQPLCSPARACLFTGQYATQTGVWHLGPGLRRDATTLATELRKAGYSANCIGKWHLAPNDAWAKPPQGLGYVPPEYRGGKLVYDLGSVPNTTWGSDPAARPPSYADGMSQTNTP
jgi:hypothetical protein